MKIEKIKEVKSGNKEAFEEILMENIDYFYKIAYIILKNEDKASEKLKNRIRQGIRQLDNKKKKQH